MGKWVTNEKDELKKTINYSVIACYNLCVWSTYDTWCKGERCVEAVVGRDEGGNVIIACKLIHKAKRKR